jgi:hypothetical protein
LGEAAKDGTDSLDSGLDYVSAKTRLEIDSGNLPDILVLALK